MEGSDATSTGASNRLADLSPNPVWRESAEGRVLYANPPARVLLDSWGVGAGIPVGSEWLAEIQAVLATGLSRVSEHAAGSRWYELTFVADITAGEVCIYGRDSTRRWLAEKEVVLGEERFRKLVQDAPVALRVTRAGNIEYANRAYLRLFGYHSLEQVAGVSLLQHIAPASRQEVAERAARREQGLPVSESNEVMGLRADGTSFPLLVQVSRLEFSDGPGVVGFFVDHSEHRQAEEALLAERSTLERRVEERTAQLQTLNVDLASALRHKDEFLATMSHELRTPLNAVIGITESLQELVYGPLNVRQLESLRLVAESGGHLLGLINDILDLAKIDASRLELDTGPVELAEVCHASLRFVRQAAQQKQIDVEFTLDSRLSMFLSDGRRLKQILVNLLSNAVKFTPDGGRIGLDVARSPDGSLLHLAVWDTGIGISPEGMQRLFKPFVQLDSRLSRRYEGSGLGLALVRRLTELLQGDITVQSEPGQGSRFTVTLPWAAADVPLAPEIAREPVVPQAARQSLPTGEQYNSSEQLLRYLVEQDIQAGLLICDPAAVERVLAQAPAVVLVDLARADSSAWNALAELKRDPRSWAIPVVAISAIGELTAALALGAEIALARPVAREELRAALVRLVPPRPGADPRRAVLLAALPEGEESAARSPLILLAEDNEATYIAYGDFLEASGYRVKLACDGLQAVAAAIQGRPDLILMDIQMPLLDGLEVIRRIRADAALDRVPIIALTALAMPGDRERCLAAGANAYLSKPVGLRQLLTVVANHLGARSRAAGDE